MELPSRWLTVPADEAEAVLRAALELAVADGRLSGFSERPAKIPVLLVGVGAIPLPTFDGVDFFKVSAEELQRLADHSGSHIFYLDVKVAWREGDEFFVQMDKLPRYSKGTTYAGAHGAGITARFRKTAHGWQGEVKRAWIE